MKMHDGLETAFASAEKYGMGLIPESRYIREALLRRLHSGEVLSPASGVYVRTQWWQSRKPAEKSTCIVRTISTAHPEWIFGGTFAAWTYGFTDSPWLLRVPQRLIDRHSNSRQNNKARAFYATAEDMGMLRRISGMQVSDPYRTVFDCARSLTFADSLAICDAALRTQYISQENLLQFVLDHKRCKGWKLALRAAIHASPLAESGGESVARAHIIDLGFALPQLQAEFVDPDGRRRRADFLWEGADGRYIVGEFDGMKKYFDHSLTHGKTVQQIIEDEKNREDDLSLYGVSLVRFGFDIVRDSVRFAAKLNRAGVPKAKKLDLSRNWQRGLALQTMY